jgi:hypothetical protein
MQVLVSSEPGLIKELLGADLMSDDVTRRTLMLAMWAMMDRFDLAGFASVRIILHATYAFLCTHIIACCICISIYTYVYTQ